MEHHVLHARFHSAPWMVPAQRRLPGVQPLDMADWLTVDEAYDGQMALRDRLLARQRGAVLAQLPGAEAAGVEVLGTVLAHLPTGFTRSGRAITRPDGVRIDLDADTPLATAARLVQEDLCILRKPGAAGEHVLGAAALCFPASWTLSEKIGQPLGRIHTPVSRYTEDIAGRVQRMLNVIRPETPLMRANALLYERPDLYQPRSEA